MTALLEVRALRSGYGQLEVLRDFDLTVEPQTVTAVLGANGAGKSTMLKSISGLVRPTGGAVIFDGEDISTTAVESRIQRGLAHVPEGGGVVKELTVQENLRLGGLWRRGAAGARVTSAAIDEIYDLFEPLQRRRTSHGHQLSGGERQMLALGRALVARPKMMLLDEPSLGLAPPVVARITTLLHDLRHRLGLTVLLVEQNVSSALAIADDAVVLSVGRVVARGAAEDLRNDVKLRHAYLGY